MQIYTCYLLRSTQLISEAFQIIFFQQLHWFEKLPKATFFKKIEIGDLYLLQTFIELISKVLQSRWENTFSYKDKQQHLKTWYDFFPLRGMWARLHCI